MMEPFEISEDERRDSYAAAAAAIAAAWRNRVPRSASARALGFADGTLAKHMRHMRLAAEYGVREYQSKLRYSRERRDKMHHNILRWMEEHPEIALKAPSGYSDGEPAWVAKLLENCE